MKDWLFAVFGGIVMAVLNLFLWMLFKKKQPILHETPCSELLMLRQQVKQEKENVYAELSRLQQTQVEERRTAEAVLSGFKADFKEELQQFRAELKEVHKMNMEQIKAIAELSGMINKYYNLKK